MMPNFFFLDFVTNFFRDNYFKPTFCQYGRNYEQQGNLWHLSVKAGSIIEVPQGSNLGPLVLFKTDFDFSRVLNWMLMGKCSQGLISLRSNINFGFGNPRGLFYIRRGFPCRHRQVCVPRFSPIFGDCRINVAELKN